MTIHSDKYSTLENLQCSFYQNNGGLLSKVWYTDHVQGWSTHSIYLNFQIQNLVGFTFRQYNIFTNIESIIHNLRYYPIQTS